jgi:hypothetical protein
MLSPEHFPAPELIAHYHERWEVELGLDEIKTHLVHHVGAQLRSRTAQRVRQEAWGLLTLYNLVRLQMLKVAHEHGVPARELNFRCAALLIASDPAPGSRRRAPPQYHFQKAKKFCIYLGSSSERAMRCSGLILRAPTART